MLNLYETYYKLDGDPFRLTPDHRFSVPHRSYANAKSYLEYALFQGEGFVIVTGEPGTGKTTLVSEILAGFDKSRIRVATLTSTQLDTRDLLHMVAVLFGLNVQEVSKPALLLSLEKFLKQQIQRGHRSVLIVDEAQGLSQPALEELRLLANLQHGNRAVLQVALVGQKQLLDLISTPDMEHLRQRVIASTTLEPLGLDETVNYVEHRLYQVGWEGNPTISGDALQLVHRFSGGVPRRINLICNRLFLYGGLEGKHALDGEDARTVIEELQQERLISAQDRTDLEDQEGMPAAAEAVNASGYNLPRAGMPTRRRRAGPSLPREGRVKSEDVIPFQQPAAVPDVDAPEVGLSASVEQLLQDTAAMPGLEEDGLEPSLSSDSTTADENYDEPPARPDATPPRNRKWGWAAAYSLLAVLVSAAVLIRMEGLEQVMAKVSGGLERYAANGAVVEQDDRILRDSPDVAEPRGERLNVGLALPAPAVGKNAEVSPAQQLPVMPDMQDQDAGKQAGAVVELAGIDTRQPALVNRQPPKADEQVVHASKQAEAAVAPQTDQNPMDAEYVRLRSQAGQRLAKHEQAPPAAEKKTGQAKSPQGALRAGSPGQGGLPDSTGAQQQVPAKAGKSKPVTATATAPAESSYSPDKLKTVLLKGRWSSQGKPAAHLPSEITYCKAQGEGINCWSVPQYVHHADGTALQKVETTLENFSTVGSFRLSFRTLVKSADADGGAEANPESATADPQWQVTEQAMICRLSQSKNILCRDVKGNTLHYQRLPNGGKDVAELL